MIRMFEAFAGYGSQAMAMKKVGIPFEVVAISEIDKYAIQAYELIHGKVNNLGDISKIDPNTIPDHDLFTYSFPCTDISLAGKQVGLDEDSGTRSGLLWECQKVISAKKPRYLMMENVKNLVGAKHRPNFDKWLEWLSSQGYATYWEVVNALDCNVPQNRERIIAVSILGGAENEFEFPPAAPRRKSIGDVLETAPNQEYFLSKEHISKINKWKSFQNPFDRVIGRQSICPTLTARGAGEYHSGSIILGDCDDNVNLRTAIECMLDDMYEKYKFRFLTPLESFRLMGVTDADFEKIKDLPKRQLYKLAGNSIVVDVLESVFKKMFRGMINKP
jgi:DNA-cytosine methyltransferase